MVPWSTPSTTHINDWRHTHTDRLLCVGWMKKDSMCSHNQFKVEQIEYVTLTHQIRWHDINCAVDIAHYLRQVVNGPLRCLTSNKYESKKTINRTDCSWKWLKILQPNCNKKNNCNWFETVCSFTKPGSFVFFSELESFRTIQTTNQPNK